MNQQDYINDSEETVTVIIEAFNRKFVFLYPEYLDGIGCISAAWNREGTLDFFVSSYWEGFGVASDTWDENSGYHYVGDEDVCIAEGIELFEGEDPKDMFIVLEDSEIRYIN